MEGPSPYPLIFIFKNPTGKYGNFVFGNSKSFTDARYREIASSRHATFPYVIGEKTIILCPPLQLKSGSRTTIITELYLSGLGGG